MRWGSRRDEGSAVIEFIVVGVCVLVPLVFIVQGAMTVHAAALASNQAVREAGRAFSLASNEATGRSRALAAGRLAFLDQGLSMPPGALRVSCPDGPCLMPGTTVHVALDWFVALPWLPADWLGRGRASIPISAELSMPIDDYRGSPESSGAT